ncbi:hypothetical protein ANO11243_004050 [Dothideomycetidae sp. 11243]|nr:hypothetical protein ANO11243_004050 [fungal sp. No.11243]
MSEGEEEREEERRGRCEREVDRTMPAGKGDQRHAGGTRTADAREGDGLAREQDHGKGGTPGRTWRPGHKQHWPETEYIPDRGNEANEG